MPFAAHLVLPRIVGNHNDWKFHDGIGTALCGPFPAIIAAIHSPRRPLTPQRLGHPLPLLLVFTAYPAAAIIRFAVRGA